MSSSKNLDNKKLELIQWVAEASEEYLIDRMLEMKNEPNKNWWDEISEEEKAAIEAGLVDEEAGNFISHEEARKTWEKWLTK
jgi:predicted transcriptional regulator